MNKPLFDLPFISHGHATLKDLDESVRFYRDFLGLDVVRSSKRTLVARLGSNTPIVGVTLEEKGLAKAYRPWLRNAHFGLDVPAADDVREIIVENQELFGFEVIHKVSGSHGTDGFTFSDFDNNAGQIEDYPRGGYYWMFEQGGDLANPFQPNVEDVEDWHDLIDTESYEYRHVTA